MRTSLPIAYLSHIFNPYVLIVVGLLFVWSTPFQIYQHISAHQEAARLAAIPSWSPDKIRKEISAIEQDIQQPELSEPNQYFHTLNRIYLLRDISEKMNVSYVSWGITREEALHIRIHAHRLMQSVAALQMRYINTFGAATMVDVSRQISDASHGVSPPVNMTAFWQSAGIAYLWSLIPFFLFFCLRVRGHGFVFLFEIPRILLASFCWPVALFRYPCTIDPRVQLKNSLEFACWILTVAASFFGIGGSSAVYGQNIYRGIKQKASPTVPSTTDSSSNAGDTPKNKGKSASRPFSLAGDFAVFPFNQQPDSTPPYTQIGYSWSRQIGSCGSLVGNGLIEYGDGITPFSLDFVGFKPSQKSGISWIVPGVEVGVSKKDGPFAQVGGKINITSVPTPCHINDYIRRAVPKIVIGGFGLLAGKRVRKEILIGIETRKLHLRRFSLFGNFTVRIRPGETNNFSISEVILSDNKIPIHLVTQYRLIGNQGRLSVGLRFSHAF